MSQTVGEELVCYAHPLVKRQEGREREFNRRINHKIRPIDKDGKREREGEGMEEAKGATGRDTHAKRQERR